MDAGFPLVWAGLLGAPPLALVMHFLLQRHRFYLPILIFAGSELLLSLLVALAGISFVSVLPNLACFVASYFAYSLLAMSCWRMPGKVIRVLLFVIAIIPIGIGYLLSTIGVLGLAFIIGDYTIAPEHVEELEPGLTCRITEWGVAGSSSGYAVSLYRSWPGIPFLERKVIGASVDQEDYGSARPADVSCADLFATYAKR